MKRVIILLGNEKFINIRLKKIELTEESNNQFISYDWLDKSTRKILDDLRFKPVQRPEFNETFKAKFIQEYIQL